MRLRIGWREFDCSIKVPHRHVVIAQLVFSNTGKMQRIEIILVGGEQSGKRLVGALRLTIAELLPCQRQGCVSLARRPTCRFELASALGPVHVARCS